MKYALLVVLLGSITGLTAACASGANHRSDVAVTSTPQAANDPAGVVRAYYVLLNARQFTEAYSLLTPAQQATVDHTPYDAWVKGYENTTLIDPLTVSTQKRDLAEATVKVELESVDREVVAEGQPSGRFVKKKFEGTWRLALHENTWLLDKPAIQETGETVYEPQPQVPAPTSLPPQQSTATPTPVRWVIFVAGIDSSSFCESVDSMSRQTALENALRAVETENLQVIGLSYSEEYEDCTYHGFYGAQSLPAGPAAHGHVLPYYANTDTCQGVGASEAMLARLIEHLWKPGVKFDLIGHSLGGLVVSYYVSQNDASYLQERIHSVILLDSPVYGTELRSPLSSCSSDSLSWTDLATGSYVTRTITTPANTTGKVPFVTIRSSPIGGTLPGAQDVQAGCYWDGTAAVIWGLILPVVGYFGYLQAAHSCVWFDQIALTEVAAVVSR